MKNERQIFYDEKMKKVKTEVYDELYNTPNILKILEYAGYIPESINDSDLRPENYLNKKKGSKPNKLYTALKNNNIKEAKEIVKNNEYISCSKICLDISTDVRTLKDVIATVGTLFKCLIDDNKLPKCISDGFTDCLLSLPICSIRNIMKNKRKKDNMSILSIIDNNTLKNLKNTIEYLRLIIALECNSDEEYTKTINNMNNDKNVKTIETLYEIWK